MGQPSNPSYGNALAPPLSSSSAQPSYSASNSLTDDQMLGLVLEMHSMMQVLMQNSQRPPSTQYSASSSNSFSSPTITSSSSSYSSPASSNTAPILPSSQSSISSSFRPSTSSSSPTSSSFATGSSSPDSYGNPLAQPISTSSSSQASPSSTLPPQSQSAAAAVPASSSYGSARAPAISSNSFSLPQGDSDPLVKAASTLDQVSLPLVILLLWDSRSFITFV